MIGTEPYIFQNQSLWQINVYKWRNFSKRNSHEILYVHSHSVQCFEHLQLCLVSIISDTFLTQRHQEKALERQSTKFKEALTLSGWSFTSISLWVNVSLNFASRTLISSLLCWFQCCFSISEQPKFC